MNTLPDELLMKIAIYLPQAHSFASCCRICKAVLVICINRIGNESCFRYNEPNIRVCTKCCFVLKDSGKFERGQSISRLKKRPYTKLERQKLPKKQRKAMAKHRRAVQRLYKNKNTFMLTLWLN